jgi:predicted metal-dependent phosphoesterase TrpH
MLLEKLAELRLERVERIKKITSKLRGMGVNIDHQEVFDVAEKGSPGRMHVADVLCRKGYCSDIRESFQKYLSDHGPAYVPKVSADIKRCYRAYHFVRRCSCSFTPWQLPREIC